MFPGFSSSGHLVYTLTDIGNYNTTNGETENNTRQPIHAKFLEVSERLLYFTFPNDNILDQTIYYIQNCGFKTISRHCYIEKP